MPESGSCLVSVGLGLAAPNQHCQHILDTHTSQHKYTVALSHPHQQLGQHVFLRANLAQQESGYGSADPLPYTIPIPLCDRSSGRSSFLQREEEGRGGGRAGEGRGGEGRGGQGRGGQGRAGEGRGGQGRGGQGRGEREVDTIKMKGGCAPLTEYTERSIGVNVGHTAGVGMNCSHHFTHKLHSFQFPQRLSKHNNM